MGRFLPCMPLPGPAGENNHQDSDQSQPNLLSDNSSSNSSLTSQPSLPSILSLTPHSHATSSTTAGGGAYHCLATLNSNSSYIFALSLIGKHLYSGASSGEIRVWDRNPNSSHSYPISERRCSAVKSIVAAGEILFTAHHDHKIRAWRIDNHQQKHKLITVLPTVTDHCIRLFSARNEIRRHRKSTWIQHVDTVSSLALSKDNSLLYSVSWDKTLKIWRTSDFKCIESINAHDDAINAVVSSSDGSIYTGSADKSIKIWRKHEGDKKKHSLISTLVKHKSAVNALSLSNDGSVLYSGACDRSIIVWEKDDGGGGGAVMAVSGALRGHKKAILCLCVVADLLCSGSADRTVRVWRRGSGNSYSCLAVFEGHKSPIKCLTAVLDNGGNNGYMVYSGSLDFDIKFWQIRVPL